MNTNTHNVNNGADKLEQAKQAYMNMDLRDSSLSLTKINADHIQIDRAQADRFLNMFPGLVSFQVFDEAKNGANICPKIIHGWNEATFSTLRDYNKKGAGICFMVNEGNSKGRSNNGVVRIRAVFLDLDGSPLQPVLDAGLTPHIIVESSPEKFHVYWLVNDCPLERFKDMQTALATRFNGDGCVNDLSRVLRVPGFLHQKAEPVLSRILELNRDLSVYSVEEIIDGLGLDLSDHKRSDVGRTANISDKSFLRGAEIGGRRKCIVKVARHLSRNDFSVEEAVDFCIAFDKVRNPLPLEETDPGEVETVVRDIYKRYVEQDVDIPDFVVEMNATHFVSVEDGKTSVYSERFNYELNSTEIVRFTFQSFKDFYDRKEVQVGTHANGKPILKGKGTAWLKSKMCAEYDGIALEPNANKLPPNIKNLWKGFGVKPVKGDWSLMRRHLYSVICSSNPEYFLYLIGWFAFCVQRPSELPGVAPVLQGGKGVGKGFVGTHFAKLIGRNHSMHITNAKHLVGGFNSHLRGRIFLFADEAFYAGEKQNESVLKGLITEPTITIEGKGRDALQARNMLHVLMASNNDKVISASGDERRYFMLQVSNKHAQDASYFEPAYKQMANGGLEAWLFDLLEYDLTDFDVRKVPHTGAMHEQKLHGLDTLESWWYQILYNGIMPRCETWGEIPKCLFYEDYISSKGISRDRSTETSFWTRMRKLVPDFKENKRSRKLMEKWPLKGFCENSQVACFIPPDLDACRNHFEKQILKSKIDWLV
jgi:hypothetical protein